QKALRSKHDCFAICLGTVSTAQLYHRQAARGMGGYMLFSGYIFDVEGTLVDCVRQNLLSLQESLANCGATVPYEVLQLYSGLDGDQTLQLIALRNPRQSGHRFRRKAATD